MMSYKHFYNKKRRLFAVMLLISTLLIVVAMPVQANESGNHPVVPEYIGEVFARLSFSDGSIVHAPDAEVSIVLAVKTKDGWFGPLGIRARMRATIYIKSGDTLLEEHCYESIYDDREMSLHAEIGASRMLFPFKVATETLEAPLDTIQITGSLVFEELGDDDGVLAHGEIVCNECLTFGTPSARFSDVIQNSWYQNGIDYAVSNGLYRGVTENCFAPGETMTRGMLVTVLWRMSGMPEAEGTAEFEDVPRDAYYAKAVDWAKGEVIIRGYSKESFAPNDPVTREQLATIINRYVNYQFDNLWDNAAMVRFEEHSRCTRDSSTQDNGKMVDIKPERNTAEEKARRQRSEWDIELFDDKDQISNYAYNAVDWMVWAGLMQGMPSNRFEPKANATRAQVAVVLQRLFVKDVIENFGYAVFLGPDWYIPVVN